MLISIHNLLPLDIHKMLLSNYKISNEFYQGDLTIIILVIFEDMASKLEKIGPFFFVSIHFHPCHL